MRKIDVLCLEWPQSERDIHSVAPVISELRQRGGSCVTGDIFSFPAYLLKYRPKILLISNFVGAKINHELCFLASQLGIKVFSMIAEGNIHPEKVYEMTWGYNREQIPYPEKYFVWSECSKELIESAYPQLREKLIVSGNVGVDRYNMLSFLDKITFLNEVAPDVNYRKIVGLAGWGFDLIHETESFFKNIEMLRRAYSSAQIERFREDFLLLQDMYEELVKTNPDILFIARPHPGLLEKDYDEFNKIYSYPNVYGAAPRMCPYSISDLIAVTDLWGGYETTTCLEGWLLGKETFLANPTGGDFVRDVTAEGSIQLSTAEEISCLINNDTEFYAAREVELAQIAQRRKKIVCDVVGGSEGKNYLVVVEEIEKNVSEYKHPTYTNWQLFMRTKVRMVKSFLRSLNWLNRLRNIREVDPHQIERMIAKYYS